MKKFIALMVGMSVLTFGCNKTDADKNITVTVDGEEVAFDVYPQIVNDRTMVPMRAIFEKIGADISWDDETKSVTAVLDNKTVSLTVGSKKVIVDGEETETDAEAVIIDGRTLVPVRFATECFGFEVVWESEDKNVAISTVPSDFEVHFIDVGQADCALIKKGDYAALIDGGNRADGKVICEYLENEGVLDLDFVLCTHGHEDHVGGLGSVLEEFSVGTVYVNQNYESSVFDNFINTAVEKNIPVKKAKSGDSFLLGTAEFEILAPVAEIYKDYNDTSIVLKATYKDTSFLFTGDAGEVAEKDILMKNSDVKADVLKVGHHGSRTATSEEFLNAVSPKYGVISCGVGNSYGHPHKETMDLLYKAGIGVYRTDEDGNILAVSDGESIKITTENVKSENTQNTLNTPNTQNTEETDREAVGEDEERTYIGNIKSKKLHLQSCTSLPAEKNREYFSAFSAATENGYTPCGICNPK